MYRFLDLLLCRLVRSGDLKLIDSQGKLHRYGDGTGAEVVALIANQWLEHRLVFDPYLALGEGYMRGQLCMRRGRIYDLLAILARNVQQRPPPYPTAAFDALRFIIRRIMQFNPIDRARRNAAHHYDMDGAIYDLFLDRDRQYSCGYFIDGMGLDAAQLAKKRHLAAKLALSAGQRVLDIGSGWGGLGIYMAKAADAVVTGVTLSREQLKISNERVVREGLQEAVRFELKDYRNLGGRFDRIVSVGMFEHVGINQYNSYFRKIRQLLTEDGVALIHTIGRSKPPTATDPFIAKYIFPGGYIPALSEMVRGIERSDLIIADIETLRLHYAKTLCAWRERFIVNWDKAAAIRDESFCRMWEYYLAASEAAFRYQGLVVFQVQLVKRIDVLPLTRDYMADAEQRLFEKDRLNVRFEANLRGGPLDIGPTSPSSDQSTTVKNTASRKVAPRRAISEVGRT
ncbi:MAG: cyclopropane-fatty-acyl-phospholipid synthase family protein [Rhodomicrobiaceae bacterium]